MKGYGWLVGVGVGVIVGALVLTLWVLSVALQAKNIGHNDLKEQVDGLKEQVNELKKQLATLTTKDEAKALGDSLAKCVTQQDLENLGKLEPKQQPAYLQSLLTKLATKEDVKSENEKLRRDLEVQGLRWAIGFKDIWICPQNEKSQTGDYIGAVTKLGSVPEKVENPNNNFFDVEGPIVENAIWWCPMGYPGTDGARNWTVIQPEVYPDNRNRIMLNLGAQEASQRLAIRIGYVYEISTSKK